MTEQKARQVATVIVTYNGQLWIDHCLQSLLCSDYPTDIIVIDNCSTDRTVAIIREKYPFVYLIENHDNIGFGQANNIGIRKAMQRGADFVFLMNQDAWVDVAAIGRLVEVAMSHPDCGIISPVHYNGSGDALDVGFARYASLDSSSQLAHCTDDLVFLPFVNAAFWLLPIEVVRKVGGFDPFFFYCGEDVNYVHRLHFHNYKLGYVPSAVAYHDRGVRPPDPAKQRRLDILFHWCEFFNINKSWLVAILYGPVALCKRVGCAIIKAQINDFKDYGNGLKEMVRQWKMVRANRQFYMDKKDFWSR